VEWRSRPTAGNDHARSRRRDAATRMAAAVAAVIVRMKKAPVEAGADSCNK
jgi:hypothetical protein